MTVPVIATASTTRAIAARSASGYRCLSKLFANATEQGREEDEQKKCQAAKALPLLEEAVCSRSDEDMKNPRGRKHKESRKKPIGSQKKQGRDSVNYEDHRQRFSDEG
ncbi:MAG: hypothetical protein HY681_11520 [Chloroflexi bacterium]|nr:hypothetical protein [Chloroflexota bacterium]